MNKSKMGEICYAARFGRWEVGNLLWRNWCGWDRNIANMYCLLLYWGL